ncbi:hypothetical protein D3C81_2124900 [compost metagenome]
MNFRNTVYMLALATKEYITENDQNRKYPHHPVNIVFLLTRKVSYTSKDYISYDTKGNTISNIISERHDY